MHKARCDICFNNLPLDRFCVLICGHCFCSSCMTTLKKARSPTCPHCRTPINKISSHGRRADGQPLYITIVDSIPGATSDSEDALISQMNHVRKGLAKMGEASSSKSVERAEKEIEKVSDSLKAEGVATETLIDAMKDFSSRIAPVFSEVESLRALVQTLRIEQASHSEKDILIRDLRTELKEKDRICAIAADLAERAKNDVMKLRREMTQLMDAAEEAKNEAEAHAERAKAEAPEKDREITKLKGWLDDHKKNISVQRAKRKGLQDQVKRQQVMIGSLRQALGQSHNETDGSLRVLPLEDDVSEPPAATTSPPRPSGSHRVVGRTVTFPPIETIEVNYPDVNVEFEGLPRPGFASDWTLDPATNNNTKKRKLTPASFKENVAVKGGDHRNFPIIRDGRGRTQGTVQLGSRRAMNAGW